MFQLAYTENTSFGRLHLHLRRENIVISHHIRRDAGNEGPLTYADAMQICTSFRSTRAGMQRKMIHMLVILRPKQNLQNKALSQAKKPTDTS